MFNLEHWQCTHSWYLFIGWGPKKCQRFKKKACQTVRTHVRLIVEEDILFAHKLGRESKFSNEIQWRFDLEILNLNATWHMVTGQHIKHDEGIIFHYLRWMEGRGNWRNESLMMNKLMSTCMNSQCSYNQTTLLFWRVPPKFVKNFNGCIQGTKFPKWLQLSLILGLHWANLKATVQTFIDGNSMSRLFVERT